MGGTLRRSALAVTTMTLVQLTTSEVEPVSLMDAKAHLRVDASDEDRAYAVIDFGSDVVSTGGTFSLTASTFRTQN